MIRKLGRIPPVCRSLFSVPPIGPDPLLMGLQEDLFHTLPGPEGLKSMQMDVINGNVRSDQLQSYKAQKHALFLDHTSPRIDA